MKSPPHIIVCDSVEDREQERLKWSKSVDFKNYPMLFLLESEYKLIGASIPIVAVNKSKSLVISESLRMQKSAKQLSLIIEEKFSSDDELIKARKSLLDLQEELSITTALFHRPTKKTKPFTMDARKRSQAKKKRKKRKNSNRKKT